VVTFGKCARLFELGLCKVHLAWLRFDLPQYCEGRHAPASDQLSHGEYLCRNERIAYPSINLVAAGAALILDLDPVCAPPRPIRPIAPLGDNAVQSELVGVTEHGVAFGAVDGVRSLIMAILVANDFEYRFVLIRDHQVEQAHRNITHHLAAVPALPFHVLRIARLHDVHRLVLDFGRPFAG
jgi:hypothetical protein